LYFKRDVTNQPEIILETFLFALTKRTM